METVCNNEGTQVTWQEQNLAQLSPLGGSGYLKLHSEGWLRQLERSRGQERSPNSATCALILTLQEFVFHPGVRWQNCNKIFQKRRQSAFLNPMTTVIGWFGDVSFLLMSHGRGTLSTGNEVAKTESLIVSATMMELFIHAAGYLACKHVYFKIIWENSWIWTWSTAHYSGRICLATKYKSTPIRKKNGSVSYVMLAQLRSV